MSTYTPSPGTWKAIRFELFSITAVLLLCYSIAVLHVLMITYFIHGFRSGVQAAVVYIEDDSDLWPSSVATCFTYKKQRVIWVGRALLNSLWWITPNLSLSSRPLLPKCNVRISMYMHAYAYTVLPPAPLSPSLFLSSPPVCHSQLLRASLSYSDLFDTHTHTLATNMI